jgi:hypothetical protein
VDEFEPGVACLEQGLECHRARPVDDEVDELKSQTALGERDQPQAP